MEKSATLNLRINPTFVDATQMSETEIHAKIMKDYDSINYGYVESII
ncbi:MAG: hypothetical protein ACI4EI_10750 [Muricoprocola sp.]